MDVREEILELIERKELNNSSFAHAIGYAASTVSLWLAGKYVGSSQLIDKLAMDFLQRQKERASSPKITGDFILTKNVKIGFEVAKMCHLDNEIGVLYGEAGCGKTTLIREYIKSNPTAILLETDMSFSCKVLFKELCKILGLEECGTIHVMFAEVVKKLKNSGRLIIIDEAENLGHRTLEMVRRIYDHAGIGILLVGLPRLVSNLRGKKGEYAQLYSRVSIAKRLTTLIDEDCEAIVKSYLPNSNGLWKKFNDLTEGNARSLTKLLLRSKRMAEINKCEITEKLVVKAASYLLLK